MSEPHRDPATVVRAWMDAEQQAMAGLGFHPVERAAIPAEVDGISEEPCAYAMPLDDSGEWEALVTLRKLYGGKFGRAVTQDGPSAGLAHRPTEQLIRELKRYRPGEGVQGVTMGTAGHGDLPTAEYPALTRLRVTDPDEIPAAVAETVRTVREVYLPLVRGWADVDRLVELFDGPPPGRAARTFWLERRAVLHHLRGDGAGASAALDELAQLTGDTGIEALDVPDNAFADGMRVRLGQPTRAQQAEQALSDQLTAAEAFTARIGEIQGQATADDNHIRVVVAVSGDVLRLELDPQVMSMTSQALAERIMVALAAARADALRQVSAAMGNMYPASPSWEELASGAPVDMSAPLPPLPDFGR
jgi:DNA-binding protein YbaB